MNLAKRFSLTASVSTVVLMLSIPAHAETSGQKIYTQGGASPAAMACAACHGANGMGTASAGFPRLAGLPAGYMAKQIEDFRSGERANGVMQPIAIALGDAEVDAVATYMAGMSPGAASTALDPTGPVTNAAEKLVKQGDWSRNIPACVACHGEGKTGVGSSFPPLMGQSGVYLAAQLDAWRSGTRKNDPNDLMGHVARSLTDTEVKAISTYFDSLNGEASQ